MRFLKSIPTVIAGLLFVISGLGKVGNIFAFQQIIASYGLESLNWLAPFIVLSEIYLGCALLLHLHSKQVSIVAITLVVIFTIAFSYAWHWHGITDCGCFGNYLPIRPTPLATYIRNAILIVFLVLTIIFDGSPQPEKWKIVTMGTILYTATFVAGITYKPFAFSYRTHPFENKAIYDTPLEDFSTKHHGNNELLLFFNYGCPHCINSMENFKAWQENNAVNNSIAYVLVDSTDMQLDSMRTLFHKRFPTINVIETNADSCMFIQAFPTSFLIYNDTIKHIMIGELPSHYIFQTELNTTSLGLIDN